MNYVLLGLFMCLGVSVFSQERTLLRGKVMYRDSNVINENVLNITAEQATITNENGEFEIMVALGDELVFTAVNYKITAILVSQEILDNNRLVVSVDEKVTALEEVVVGPENTEKFLALKNDRFKGYDYEIDRSTEVDNIAEAGSVQGMQNGLNFVNIFRLLFQNKDKENTGTLPTLKLSEVIRQLYEDSFFIDDLQLKASQIEPFLYYLDAQPTPRSLFKKENEFQLIDFLVNESQTFLKTTDE